MKKTIFLILTAALLFSGCSLSQQEPAESQAETAETLAAPETETPETAAPPQTESETEKSVEAPFLSLNTFKLLKNTVYIYPVTDSTVVSELMRGKEELDLFEKMEEDTSRICGSLPYKDCWYKWPNQLPVLYYCIKIRGITREQFLQEYDRLLELQKEDGEAEDVLEGIDGDLVYSDEVLDVLFGDVDEETIQKTLKNDLSYYYDGVLYRVCDLMYLGMISGYDDLLRDRAINGGLIEHLEYYADPPYTIKDWRGNELDKSHIWDESASILRYVETDDGEGYYDVSDPVKTITLREFYAKVKALAKT